MSAADSGLNPVLNEFVFGDLLVSFSQRSLTSQLVTILTIQSLASKSGRKLLITQFPLGLQWLKAELAVPWSRSGPHCHAHDRQRSEGRHLGSAAELSLSHFVDADIRENLRGKQMIFQQVISK